MEPVLIRDLKPGDYFIRKPNEYPKARQVFIRRDYDRALKRYFCERWDDIGSGIMLNGDTVVFVDFSF